MDFIPPFCPNPHCPNHHLPRDSERPLTPWYHRRGRFQSARSGEQPRFGCKCCGTTFNPSTFDVDYRLRLRVSCRDVLASLFTCQGQRQLGRWLGIHHRLVALRQSRLAAQAVALNARFFRDAHPDSEIVLDGFESFARSQYHPHHLNFVVGKHSQAIWAWNVVFFRRKGRMRADQKAKRQQLDQVLHIPRNMARDRAAELLREYAGMAHVKGVPQLRLYTDEHPAYKAALANAKLTDRVQHVTISSRKPRTTRNNLFAVNYVDRQLRKDLATLVRETTRMAQRPERELERIAVYLAWHNLNKPVRVEGPLSKITHAQLAGLSASWVEREWQRFQTERVFPAREPLREFHRRVWNREDRLKDKEGRDLWPTNENLGRLRA